MSPSPREPPAGRGHQVPLLNGRHLWFLIGEEGAGVVSVPKTGADRPEVVASKPALGGRVAATPAIADNGLCVRGEKHVYAFGDRK